MIELSALKTYLENLSDIPEEYQTGYKIAATMVNFELLLKNLEDETVETIFPFIRKTLLTAVIWTEKFAGGTAIPKVEDVLISCAKIRQNVKTYT